MAEPTLAAEPTRIDRVDRNRFVLPPWCVHMDHPTATRVVLSYPDGLSEWARDQVGTDRYRGYFARVLGTVTVGGRREEFVDVGCCGDSLDVPFRVERIEVDGEPAETAVVTADTEIAYRTRPGDVDGGWRVQSGGGPRA